MRSISHSSWNDMEQRLMQSYNCIGRVFPVLSVSCIISNNPNLLEVSLHTNTLYYLEEYIFSYVKKMNFSFRTNNDAKKKVMVILDYLVSKGSTLGFLLREEIL